MPRVGRDVACAAAQGKRPMSDLRVLALLSLAKARLGARGRTLNSRRCLHPTERCCGMRPLAISSMSGPADVNVLSPRSQLAPKSRASGHLHMIVQHQRPYLASYCLVRADDAILLQRRFNTGYLDGQWALPSGHVNEGE